MIKGNHQLTKYNTGYPTGQKINRMIFNYDFVCISSLSGMRDWGEYNNMEKMIHKLEELREKNELLAIDHTVLMVGYIKTSNGTFKKEGVHKLSCFNGVWALRLDLPLKTNKRKMNK